MDREITYKALHRNVLIVYVVEPRFDTWVAYCVPVPGESHEREKDLYTTDGVKLQEWEARALYPWLVEKFDNHGLKWRR